MGTGANYGFDASVFSGKVRIFPLPNLVLFPGALQPLHIFEPRYRDLMAESIATDGLMALALLTPGWEKNYEGRPPIHPVACLSRVTTYHRLPDGRYNLLVHGVARVRIVEEFDSQKSFREGRGELLDDLNPAEPIYCTLERELIAGLEQLLSTGSPAEQQLRQLVNQNVPLGTLCDLVAYAADMDVATKAELLAEVNVEIRARTVLSWLATSGKYSGGRDFPPGFSVN